MKKTQQKHFKARRLAELSVLTFCLLLVPMFSFAKDANGKYETVADIVETPMGMLEGSIYASEAIRQGYLPADVQVLEYNTDIDAIQSLLDGKIKSVINTDINGIGFVEQYDELMFFPGGVGVTEYAYGFRKGSPILGEFNKALLELQAEGLNEVLEAKWYVDDISTVQPKQQDWKGEKGVLKFWVNIGAPPMAFVGSNGEIVGYSVDYALSVCERMGYNVEVTECNFSGLIPAVTSGEADFVGRTLSITEERKKAIDFSEPWLRSEMYLLVRKDNVTPALVPEGEAKEDAERSFFEQMKESFVKTFVTDNRWQLFARGIGTTLLITVVSAVVGTFLGLLLVMILRLKCKPVNKFISAFNNFLAGVPVVVVLLVMYYIVFKTSTLTSVTVAIITFTILFAIGVMGLLQAGLEGVGKGQEESAIDLGFTKSQTFFTILLPQVILYVMPLYRAKIVEHLKATAIVGYIAIQDLTKMGDLVRSRTFEPFFPLIVTAILYYLIGKLLNRILIRLERKMQPGVRGSLLLKGVKGR